MGCKTTRIARGADHGHRVLRGRLPRDAVRRRRPAAAVDDDGADRHADRASSRSSRSRSETRGTTRLPDLRRPEREALGAGLARARRRRHAARRRALGAAAGRPRPPRGAARTDDSCRNGAYTTHPTAGPAPLLLPSRSSLLGRVSPRRHPRPPRVGPDAQHLRLRRPGQHRLQLPRQLPRLGPHPSPTGAAWSTSARLDDGLRQRRHARLHLDLHRPRRPDHRDRPALRLSAGAGRRAAAPAPTTSRASRRTRPATRSGSATPARAPT